MDEHTAKDISRGRCERLDRLGVISVVHARYRQRARLAVHAHADAYFSFVWSGVMSENVNGRDRALGPGSVIVRRAGEPHSNAYGPAGTCLSIMSIPETPSAPDALRPVVTRSMTIESGPGCAAAMRCFRRLLAEREVEPEATVEDVIRVIDLAGAGHESPPRRLPPWLESARECIEETFREPLGIAELAREVGVHQTHLARTFRRVYGSTIHEFRRRLRVVHAARRLRSTHAPIAQVAIDSGFSDQAHLTRACRIELGSTPARLRASCRG